MFHHKYKDIYYILPRGIKGFFANLSDTDLLQIEEIRLRKERPLIIKTRSKEFFIKSPGRLSTDRTSAYTVSGEEVNEILRIISRGSLYAFEEELKNGYITIKGGHRIGFVGEAVVHNGHVKTLKNINSLNIRIARELPGCADSVIPYIITGNKVLHTLIVSPPGCGKTTLLRDIIRQLSNGIPKLKFSAITIGLVDERSEIAGCFNGIPQLDVGIRTDVLDKCPKARGMIILVRSMTPQVIATDELGGEEDTKACEEILNAGITLLATAHGSSLEELMKRPGLRPLIDARIFKRYVFLDRSSGPGNIADILNSEGESILFTRVSGGGVSNA